MILDRKIFSSDLLVLYLVFAGFFYVIRVMNHAFWRDVYIKSTNDMSPLLSYGEDNDELCFPF